jgi:hypothetical protein
VTSRSPEANGCRRGSGSMDLEPLLVAPTHVYFPFWGLIWTTRPSARGSELPGARQPIAHGFEALVKPCKRFVHVPRELSGTRPCTRRLGMCDTITSQNGVPCLCSIRKDTSWHGRGGGQARCIFASKGCHPTRVTQCDLGRRQSTGRRMPNLWSKCRSDIAD